MASNATRQAICILAMHRSGSSAIARVLNLLGIDIGPSDSLMPAKPDNPSGFWEQEPIVEVNDRILATLGCRWDSPFPIPARLRDSMYAQFREDLCDRLRTLFPTAPIFAWKDPRSLLLFDLWQRALTELGIETKCLLALRHPLDIAASLERRNGIPMDSAIAIWTSYHLEVGRIAARVKLATFSYDALLAAWEPTLRRVFADLELDWPEAPPTDAIASFLDPGLRHSCSDAAAPVEGPFGFPVDRLYRWLLTYRTGDAPDPALESQARRLGDGLEPYLRELGQLAERHSGLERAYRELAQAYRSALVQAEAHERELAAVRAEQMELQARLARMSETLSWRLTAPLRHAGWLASQGATARRHLALEIAGARRVVEYEGTRALARRGLRRLVRALKRLSSASAEPAASASDLASCKADFVAAMQRELAEFLSSDGRLDFSTDTPPSVSIVLVLYNRAELTLACLRSILSEAGCGIQLVIVDNRSTDRTDELLARIAGATIVRNDENLHFLRACNQALPCLAAPATLFLNNDAELLPGSLTAARRTLEASPDIGAVGGKIILLDGTLQEAGSIVWSDGSCLGYGRGAGPDEPQYNFRREVDYCSGAFLLTPTAILREIGGFDGRFAPAYYEETDYCLELRSRGYKIVYEPDAAIRHFEFASSASSAAALDLQRINREKFLAKRREQLAAHYPPAAANVLRARHATPRRPALIYIDDRLPHVALGSGFPRANFILNSLPDLGFAVTAVPLNFPDEDDYATAYRDVRQDIEVMLGIGRHNLHSFLSARRGSYDILWISRPHNKEFLDIWIAGNRDLLGNARIAYDAEAIFALRELKQASIRGKPLSRTAAHARIQKETDLAGGCHLVIAVTEQEKRIFADAHPSAQHAVLGHAIACRRLERPFGERADLLFVGNLQEDSSPNVDSVVWLVRNALDKVLARLPGIRLHLVGLADAPALRKLANPSVVVHGRVDDIERFYRDCRVFVAPTRFAAGIPIKVQEASAHGLPVVASALLQSQLGWTDGRDLLAVDLDTDTDGSQFAAAIVTAYTEPRIWSSLRTNALERIANECSPESFRQTLATALKQTLAR